MSIQTSIDEEKSKDEIFISKIWILSFVFFFGCVNGAESFSYLIVLWILRINKFRELILMKFLLFKLSNSSHKIDDDSYDFCGISWWIRYSLSYLWETK
jgi:hypothetical protein